MSENRNWVVFRPTSSFDVRKQEKSFWEFEETEVSPTRSRKSSYGFHQLRLAFSMPLDMRSNVFIQVSRDLVLSAIIIILDHIRVKFMLSDTGFSLSSSSSGDFVLFTFIMTSAEEALYEDRQGIFVSSY